MDKAENVGGRALSYVQTIRWTAGRRWHNVFRKLSSTPHSHADVRYRADITAGSLKVAESRRVAELLLKGVDDTAWKRAIVDDNILQARSPESAKRLARLIRARLEPLGPELWRLVRDGKGPVATHAVFAAAVKDTRSLKLLQVHVAEPVLWLLKDRGETYVLRCLAASP
jgi:hypothetical protein